MMTSSSDAAVWEVYKQSGDRIVSLTSPSPLFDQYWVTVPEQQGAVFGVKTCTSAHVLVSAALGVMKAANNVKFEFSTNTIRILDNDDVVSVSVLCFGNLSPFVALNGFH